MSTCTVTVKVFTLFWTRQYSYYWVKMPCKLDIPLIFPFLYMSQNIDWFSHTNFMPPPVPLWFVSIQSLHYIHYISFKMRSTMPGFSQTPKRVFFLPSAILFSLIRLLEPMLPRYCDKIGKMKTNPKASIWVLVITRPGRSYFIFHVDHDRWAFRKYFSITIIFAKFNFVVYNSTSRKGLLGESSL